MSEKSNLKLQTKILELEEELFRLKNQLEPKKTVKVPDELEAIFSQSQKIVNSYFQNLNLNPEKGTIEINDERYILVRASSLSNDFFNNIGNMYFDKSKDEAFNIAHDFLFDVAHLIGIEDAKEFHKKMNLIDPISKLSAGPIHFAHTGWAFVEVLPESKPVANETFYLKFNHPYSFEADSWIKSGKKADKSVCVMNAGYSSGWCEESFGIPLTTVELTCRAKGDDYCTFIMAHPSKINEYLESELQKSDVINKPQIPFFFERKEIEDKFQKYQNLLENSQKIAKLGNWEYDCNTEELIWSKELYNIFEIDSNKTKNHHLFDHFIAKVSPEFKKDLISLIEEAATNGKQYETIYKINLSNNKSKWIFANGIPIIGEKGKIIRVIGYSQDITDRINNEVQINQFFNLSNDLLCLANFDGYFLKISKGWEDTLGYTYEELCSKPFMSLIHEDDIEKTLNEYKSLKEGALSFGFENRYRCKDDTYKILRWNGAPDKKTELIYCIVRDVTEERKAEQKLKSTLHDKEILLKEVHHRVKNNLQIISSLLNLQTSYIKDDSILNLFKDSQNRIKSIASIHELLYQASEFGTIDFNQYLNKLVTDLIYSYHGVQSQINYKIETECKFNIDTSIPLGLLINEILSNSLKHGLKNKSDEIISVSINELKNNKYELKISDDGIGFVFEKEFEKAASLGLMLIKDLASQLNGEIHKLDTKKGTYYQLIFMEN
jgi:PAS domain S-box-containing protein